MCRCLNENKATIDKLNKIVAFYKEVPDKLSANNEAQNPKAVKDEKSQKGKMKTIML